MTFLPTLPDRNARDACLVLGLLLLPLMLALSLDFGVTWDEEVQQEYGEQVAAYFASGLSDRAALSYRNLYLYGGMFDLICVAVQAWVSVDDYVVRHLVNAGFGWLGVVFCGIAAYRLFGPKTALLAMVLLVLSPRYFGHAMNNPKDIPFTAMGAAVLCGLAGARATYPFFSRRQALALAGAIALAINVRAGGMLYACYAALLVACLAWLSHERDVRRLSLAAGQLAVVGLIALVLGTAFWPWAQQQPIVRPFQALEALTHLDWGGDVLYRGRTYAGGAVPWDYPLYYLVITTPPVVLAGAVLSVVLASGRRLRPGTVAGLWFMVLFPLGYVVARGAVLYDGMRQLLFVYTPLVIVSAAGWMLGFRVLRSTAPRVVLTLALGVGLLEPLVFQLRNHPFQTVYFNQVIGGPRGALFRFELDYWGNSLLRAVEWTEEVAQGTPFPVTISAGAPWHVVDLDARRRSLVTHVFSDVEASHLHLELLRADPAELAAMLAHPDIVHVVRMADGAPLSLIRTGTRRFGPEPE